MVNGFVNHQFFCRGVLGVFTATSWMIVITNNKRRARLKIIRGSLLCQECPNKVDGNTRLLYVL